MSEGTPQLHMPMVALPESAPRVRITAGVGTATQKSWNLRRPVTLIGSRRPAHILLHGRDVSAAHCVIVNTGSEVLLKDLHTRRGTRCGDARIDLTILKDGDVIDISGNRIQVAIQIPQDVSDDSGVGMAYDDPTLFPGRVEIRMSHTQQRWRLRESVTLLGRHEASPILLDHDEVARRHAIFFKFQRRPAIFDLGGQESVRVNGRICSLALLQHEDRIVIGPFRLQIESPEASGFPVENAFRASASLSAGMHAASSHKDHAADSQHAAATGGSTSPASPGASGPRPGDDFGGESLASDSEVAVALGHDVAALREDIADSWQQLNDSSYERDVPEATNPDAPPTDLGTREAELDAMDAALRGQLHDLQRLEELLSVRERQLDVRQAELNTESDLLAERHAACASREAELTRRLEELSRREHVFAQRYSRLHGTSCPHCGKTI